MKPLPMLLFCCAAIACGKPAEEHPDATQPGIPEPPRSGTLTFASGVLRFISCGDSGSGAIIADRPDSDAVKLIGEFGPADGRLTALLRIENDSLREIRYVGLEGPRCGELPPPGELIASGTEPFWHLQIGAGAATLRTPEDTAGVTWKAVGWSAGDASPRLFLAARGGTDTLRLELTAERCADGMSGARYPYRATLTQHGVSMKGCALEGRTAEGDTP